jgi:hypothetical protein
MRQLHRHSQGRLRFLQRLRLDGNLRMKKDKRVDTTVGQLAEGKSLMWKMRGN